MASAKPKTILQDIAITSDPLVVARRVLAMEAKGLDLLSQQLDDSFAKVIDVLRHCRGRVIVSGMGKSGHIARKISASLASTGTPAQFVHAAEAAHGDLGMITERDVILALSWSGETSELASLIDYAKRFGITLIAISSRAQSSLMRAANHTLLLPDAAEACPNGLAPTTSTTMQLALGDAIAIALLESKGFSPEDFRRFHPGGKLGASLIAVRDIMHQKEAMPLVTEDTLMSDALIVMSAKSLGCLGVVDSKNTLIGIITDGDLRRHMSAALLQQPASKVMTRKPKTIAPDTIASQALHSMTRSKIQGVFVVEQHKPIGFVHLHDLLRIGVA